jgi:FkbM family methyltransferase
MVTGLFSTDIPYKRDNLMKNRFYGQHGEDCLLWAFFGDKTTGFYVDVGAFDGRYVSNTYSFEQGGWQGICIEPHPVTFDLLKSLRNSICLNVACVADESIQTVTFYTEKLGLLSGIQVDGEDVKRRYQKRGLEFDGFDTIKVPAITLNHVLTHHLPSGTEIDFVSIDVEGTELDVLAGLDLKRFKPRVFVIETNTSQEQQGLTDFLAEHGYIFARKTGVNSFYVRSKQDAVKLQSVGVECDVEATPHPFGTSFTAKRHEEGYHVSLPAEIKLKPTLFVRVKHLIKRLLQKV